MHKILIVEDDATIARVLQNHLAGWGYQVAVVKDFQRVVEEFLQFGPQLVLLDISLPYFNGHHWCTEIRKRSQVPVIYISSASDNMNVVMAVNMGGDDFIAKPFDLSIVTAKIQALLRRTYTFQGNLSVQECGEVLLNLADTTLSYRGERRSRTNNVFRRILVLMENAGKVVSRDTLMIHLWESDNFIDDNTLTVNITRLRRKLAGIGLEDFIKTKKGIGYMVEAQ
ncbi:MAG: response regulator transcription factor [Clostridiales bacterium]|nr:response regulator transcription factor [Clostridiales bacterium]